MEGAFTADGISQSPLLKFVPRHHETCFRSDHSTTLTKQDGGKLPSSTSSWRSSINAIPQRNSLSSVQVETSSINEPTLSVEAGVATTRLIRMLVFQQSGGPL